MSQIVKLPALYGCTPARGSNRRYAANTRLQAFQMLRISQRRGDPIDGWFANLPEGEKILDGNRYLPTSKMQWPRDLVLCPFCLDADGSGGCKICRGSRVTRKALVLKRFGSSSQTKNLVSFLGFGTDVNLVRKEETEMPKSSTATVVVRPWRVYVKAYDYVSQKEKRKFLPRFRKVKASLQDFVDKLAEDPLPFIPEVNRGSVLAREVEAFLKKQGLKRFGVSPMLSGGCMVSDDQYGQALRIKVDPKGVNKQTIVERRIKMPSREAVKKRRVKSEVSLSRGRAKIAQKSKVVSKTKSSKGRKTRLIAGVMEKSEITQAIDAVLKKTLPNKGFTRDDVMDQLFQKAPFKGKDRVLEDAVWRVLINYLWELMDQGKVEKLSRREYSYKAGKGKALPKVDRGKKKLSKRVASSGAGKKSVGSKVVRKKKRVRKVEREN